MNIGVDIRCLADRHRTGVGEYTLGFLNALFHIDKENQYYLFYNSFSDVSEFIPKWDQSNVHVVRTKWPNKLFHFLARFFHYPKIDKIIGKKIDVFLSPNIHFTCLSKSVKHIQVIHDLSFEHFPACFSWKRRLWHWILQPRRIASEAHLILTPSEATRNDIIHTYNIDRKKIICLRPGLLESFVNSVSISGEDIKSLYNLPQKYILFIGTVEPRKNILSLIQAFQGSKLRSQHFELIIAGKKGWSCVDIFHKIDNTPGVRYIGYVPEEDKKQLYKMATVFVFPSLYEGFGFPILEARSMHTPVITGHRSSLPEAGGDGVLFVNPMDTYTLEESLLRLCSRSIPEEFFSKTKNEKYSWDNSAKKFLDIVHNYESI